MITFCIKKSERFCHLNVKFSFSPLQIFEISFQIFEITLQIFNISLQIFEISLQIFEISLQIFEISFQIFEISFQIFEIPPPLKLYNPVRRSRCKPCNFGSFWKLLYFLIIKQVILLTIAYL